MVPSGRQLEIASGEQRAVIVEVGGGIRVYEHAGRPVLDGYPGDALCDGARGTPLIPWPNRLQDGSYAWEGETLQVDLSEPEHGNAIHGLLRWRAWEAVEHGADRVTMATRLHPSPGYPFLLDARVTYALAPEGLAVTTTLTNAGDRACPVGAGQHPYLSPGAGAVLDDCTVQLAAGERIVVDEERELPTGREPVAGTEHDFREPRSLRGEQLDSAFCALDRDGDGRAWARLACPDGATVALWADAAYPYLQLYTGDTLAADRRRQGLACEPTTCPANALRTGEGLVRLEPGSSLTATWGVGLATA